jgi:hypothetical protein
VLDRVQGHGEGEQVARLEIGHLDSLLAQALIRPID